MSASPVHCHERPRRDGLVAALFALACAVLAFLLGDGYIDRLPQHAGYFLIAVDDAVRVPIPVRPRRTVLIVVDGLRRDFAESMGITKRLAERGQCRISDQGTYTVSRPEYALLSTGLEVDRSGARNNDLTLPLSAESVWQVARESGLSVAGSSHVPWFQQLFPGGFDRFRVPRSHEDDVFSPGAPADVEVYHPLYVDEAGHHHGARSAEYAAAVVRADHEIGALLDRLDLGRDAVVFTADQGHRDAGGHGGAQPEIREVLACFAGFHVKKVEGRPAFDGRSTAPLLAVLLGVRFPRHMRAGDDGLDVLWDIASFDADVNGEAYVRDRRAAIASFRDENRRTLAQWLGGDPGSWPRLYARESQRQVGRAIAVSVVLAIALGLRLRRAGARWGGRAVGVTMAWLAATLLATYVFHRLVLGDFDYTVINLREQFLPRAFGIVAMGASASIAAHVTFVRRLARFVDDGVTLIVILLAMNVGHVIVYGWPLGFPLPPAVARYWPFFGAVAWVGFSVMTMAAGAWLAFRARRSQGLQ